MKKIWWFLIVCTLMISSSLVWAGWNKDFSKKVNEIRGEGYERSELSERQIIDGLKEALHVATAHAANFAGQKDGFFGNPAIKIPMPEQLETIEKLLRKTGHEEIVDEFVLSMNRAAEQAAPAAKKIFWDAIVGMSFDDARKILQGNDTAATEYFRLRTSEKLRTAFLPAIREATDDVGVTRNYKALVEKTKTVPFLKSKAVNVDDYVADKALDGLFYLVGEEEKRIREDPLARVSDILKRVFGRR